jgi:hypothetical protein
MSLYKIIAILLFNLLIYSTALAESFSFNHPLVDAADQGDEDALVDNLRKGYRPDSRGEFGVTPLMRAAFHGHKRLVRILIYAGADVDAADFGGATALHIAARQGHVLIVKLLLKAGVEVDEPDEDGLTTLMKAATTQNKAIIAILLKAGASPFKRNKTGQDAIELAAQTGNLEVTSLFPYQLKPIDNHQKIEISGLPWLAEKKTREEIIGLPWLKTKTGPKIVAKALKQQSKATRLKKPKAPKAKAAIIDEKPKEITISKAVRIPISAKPVQYKLNKTMEVVPQLWLQSSIYTSEYEALLKYQLLTHSTYIGQIKAKVVLRGGKYNLLLGPIRSMQQALIICEIIRDPNHACVLKDELKLGSFSYSDEH